VCMFHHVDAGVRFSDQPAFLGTEVAALHRAHTSGFSSALQQLSHILPRIAVPLGPLGIFVRELQGWGKEREGKCRVGSCCGH